MSNMEDLKQTEELEPQDGITEQEAEGTPGEYVGKEAIEKSDSIMAEGEQVEVPLEDTPLDVVAVNSKLENYDVILEKFTDILTISESKLILTDESVEVKKNIINIGLEVYSTGAKYCESGSDDDLYKFIAKNFEFLGIYLFTFSNEESPVGILTSKIDNLLYDYIGNQEDLLQQFNIFQANFRNDKTYDLKSLVSPLIFNLSNLGTNIGCIKSIMHYIRLSEEKSIETVLESILQHIEK